MTTPPTPPTDNLAAEGGLRSEMSEQVIILCETPNGCTCGAPADTPTGMHHCDCAIHPGWCGSTSCLPCERNGKTR